MDDKRVLFHVLNGDEDVARSILGGMTAEELETLDKARDRLGRVLRSVLSDKLNVFGTHTAPIIPGREKKRPRELCGDCDGVGWTEGGKTLKTTCPTCNGTGETPRKGGG